MSSFMGLMGARTAMQVLPQVGEKSPSGWDSFLRGAASFAGNFATGVAAGLQSYDPNRPLSGIAGGYLGATRGLQTQADIEEARVKGAAGIEMRREQSAAELEARRAQQASDIQMGEQRVRAESRLEEDLARQAAAGASIMQPGMGGVMAGVQQPGRARLDDAGVQVGSSLATENILRLIGMQR